MNFDERRRPVLLPGGLLYGWISSDQGVIRYRSLDGRRCRYVNGIGISMDDDSCRSASASHGIGIVVGISGGVGIGIVVEIEVGIGIDNVPCSHRLCRHSMR